MSSPQTMLQTGPAPQQIVLQAGLGYIVSACVGIAAKLNIPDAIAAGSNTLSELASRTKTKPEMLFRLLRVLEMAGLVSRDSVTSYSLTASGCLLCSSEPNSMGDLVEWIADPLHFQIYSHLRYSFESGEPTFEHVYGEPCFQWMNRPENADETCVFQKAMVSFSRICVPAFLDAYDFSQFDTMVDLGGGLGGVIRAILHSTPRLRGIIADMPFLESDARQAITADKLSDRCEFVGCDFFASVPVACDAYFMKHILHDWDDAKATQILRNIRSVIPAHGKLIVADAVLDDGPAPHPAKLIDIEMIAFPGGKERTEAEFRSLFAETGFKLTRVIQNQSPLALIEAVPV
jgi:hypothetical protein